MKSIKLMPDYQCWPLWWGQGCDQVGNIDPSILDLPPTFLMQLREWADVYDSFIDSKESNQDPFSFPSHKDEFENFGIQLWRKLTRSLAHRYNVVYFSSFHSRLFSTIKEYEKFIQKRKTSQIK